MGKVLSLANPFRNFNVESRAHKVISQSKPVPAPKHKTDQLDFERLMKEYPEVYEASLKKDQKLDRFLKDVYVESYDPNVPTPLKQNPDRPLPLDRRHVQDFDYGVKEPEKIPLGKVSLKQILEFLSKHQTEPKKFTAKKIADEYMLPEDKVESVLKYFKVLEIYIPDQRSTKAAFAGPSVIRHKLEIKARQTKKLSPGEPPKEKT